MEPEVILSNDAAELVILASEPQLTVARVEAGGSIAIQPGVAWDHHPVA